jgi:GNAT superfamily N-acetyltransferase
LSTVTDLEVRTATSRADLEQFIRLPWRIYRNDPVWVPPLLVEMRRALDRAHHPFYEHARVECFLALRGRDVVGRIAAIVNHAHNQFHEDRVGFFGLFECIDDQPVADALLEQAESWLQAQGCDRARGPMNFSTNDELYSPGVLIDGFDTPPKMLMGHTPAYYAALLSAAGYVKAKDLLAYWMDADETPERLLRGVRRLRQNQEIKLRKLDLRNFDSEVARVKEVYNAAWERNWGFVPMTDAEVDHMAKSLRPIVDPQMCIFAELDGKPVGFAIELPDYNQALRHVNGKLFPFGVFKFLWYKRQIDCVRVLTLGAKPEYRQQGVYAMLMTALMDAGQKSNPNKARGEASWILEDNYPMRRGIERSGGRVYKTYRVFEKVLLAP